MDEHLLAEQIDYYRQRADEYDDFWARAGQYALAAEPLRRWRSDAAQATDAVRAWVPAGDVLELACGTGLWTQHLAAAARTVVAVDAAPEMLARNAERLSRHPARERVAYVEADLFTWAPPAAAFDGVFMGYWHSHLPDAHLAPFWQRVAEALRPDGSVFLVDSAPPPDRPEGDGSARHERRALNDGRQFGIVKRNWGVAPLTELLSRLGWEATAGTTRHGGILLATAHRR